MYVRFTEYSATELADTSARYRCVHCSHETMAHAFAYGAGTGHSAYGIDDAGAQRRAVRGAAAAAAAQARLSIQIAACPKCGRRDERPIRALKLRTLILCMLVLVVPIVLVWWSGQRWQAAVFVGALIGAVPSGLLWKHRTSRIYSKQVRFDSSS